MTIINYLGADAFINRSYYLLDTFRGLESTQLTKNELDKLNRFGQPYSECYEDVKRTFREFAFVKLIRGIIPNTLLEVPSQKVVFMHIDLNSAKPEVATLR